MKLLEDKEEEIQWKEETKKEEWSIAITVIKRDMFPMIIHCLGVRGAPSVE